MDIIIDACAVIGAGGVVWGTYTAHRLVGITAQVREAALAAREAAVATKELAELARLAALEASLNVRDLYRQIVPKPEEDEANRHGVEH